MQGINDNLQTLNKKFTESTNNVVKTYLNELTDRFRCKSIILLFNLNEKTNHHESNSNHD